MREDLSLYTDMSQLAPSTTIGHRMVSAMVFREKNAFLKIIYLLFIATFIIRRII